MPDEINGKEPESRFEFVNKFRRYEDNKSREYAEYKLEKLRKQKENNNKGKKK